MMIVTRAQYGSLGAQSKKEFIEKIMPLVRKQYPEKTWESPDEKLYVQIETAIDRAIAYRITAESDVYSFVLLDYRLGSKFEDRHEHRDIWQILVHRTLTGQRKIEKILDLVYTLE